MIISFEGQLLAMSHQSIMEKPTLFLKAMMMKPFVKTRRPILEPKILIQISTVRDSVFAHFLGVKTMNFQ